MNSKKEKKTFYNLKIDQIYEILGSSEKGLKQEQIEGLVEKYGFNEIPRKRGSLIKAILPQVFDYVIILLLICAIVLLIFSFIGDAPLSNSLLIFGVVFLNSIFVFVQMFNAQKSLEKLQELAAHKAFVIRDNIKMEISAKELVPGDIVILQEGDYVPADIRIIEANNLLLDESCFTGESIPVKKTIEVILEKDIDIHDQKNIVFNGTVIIKGNGKGIVINTGINTFLGQIASGIKEISMKEVPLQKKMKQLGRILSVIIVALVIFLFVLQIITMVLTNTLTLIGIGDRLYQMVSLVVAAVPWNFPLIITLVLLKGIINLARRNVIVKKLASIESLGRISVICSDKTGTLTKNEMTVQKIWFNNKIYTVTGIGYKPQGEILLGEKKINPLEDEYFKILLLSGTLNVNADLIVEEEKEINLVGLLKIPKQLKYKIIGDPTEGCLIVLARKCGINSEQLNKFSFIKEVPFDSIRMLMTKVFQLDDKIYAFTKGSIERMLEKSKYIILNNEQIELDNNTKMKILEDNKKINRLAYRTLGIGYKVLNDIKSENIEENITFLGFVGMIDPPRESVKEAINLCDLASIKSVMITGDSRETAKAIAEEIGIYKENDLIIEGTELYELEVEQFERVSVFSRIMPENKKIIVNGYQSNGHLVAMTGDGINDAVALEMADTGVSMGSGTDVAKNASDIIILDDNFATIVNGIHQGRGIFNNIRKCVVFQLVNNLAELIIMVFFILFFGVSLQLVIYGETIYLWDVFNPNQLFSFYLTTHTLPILALILDPYDKNIMKIPPKNPKEGIISKNVIIEMILQILSMALITCIIFYSINIYSTYYASTEPLYAYYYHLKGQTMAFITLFLAETWNVFNIRHDRNSLFSNYLSNWFLILLIALSFGVLLFFIISPFGHQMLSLVTITPLDWIICYSLSFLVLGVIEFYKYFLRKLKPL
ncbi:MAG: cation-translocating P-type ATPase [Candidatus Helarchaeota archaeon]